jgi:putative aminopeptidase FrvX
MAAQRRRSSRVPLALLRRLCEAVAVSGEEDAVREIVKRELGAAGYEQETDALGNLLLRRRPRSGRGMRVLLDAHMDEVGFMIVAEDGEGLYQFKTIGGVAARELVGKQIVVGRKKTAGVIGAKPIHLAKEEELKHPVAEDALRVDLGPGGKVKVGDRGTFAPNFRRVGPSLISKALDNRVGVATLVELAKRAPRRLDLMFAFTVQEEIGTRGAKVAASRFRPEAAIVVDSTPANDLPMQYEGENTFYNSRLGEGPALYVMDRGAISDRRLAEFVEATARKKQIPYQIRQPGGGGTNAGAIQRAIAGVPVVSISVPHRYTHTAASLARVVDWSNTIRLLEEVLQGIEPGILRGRP